MAQHTQLNKVTVSSSWTISGDPQAILSVRKSSTEDEEPSPSDPETSPPNPLTLSRHTADSEQPCYLYLDLSAMSGCVLSSLELISESRTLELYSGEDYLMTAKGVFNKRHADDVKLYSCKCGLPSNMAVNKAALKLLSLKGKTQVTVHKLHMEVRKAHSNSVQETAAVNPAQFLSSVLTQDLPPFLQNLVSSLQSVSVKGSEPNMPSDLSRMGDAFRQIRSVLAAPVAQTEEAPSSKELNGKQEETLDNTEVLKSDSIREQDRLLNALEERLKSYVDTKFEELEQKLEARLEEMLNRLGTERDRKADVPVKRDCNSTTASGFVEDSDQLD